MKRIVVIALVIVMALVSSSFANIPTLGITIDDFFVQFAQALNIDKTSFNKSMLYNEGTYQDNIGTVNRYSLTFNQNFHMVFSELASNKKLGMVGVVAHIPDYGSKTPSEKSKETGLLLSNSMLGIVKSFNSKMADDEISYICLELVLKANLTGFFTNNIDGITYSHTVKDGTHTFMAMTAK